MLVCTFFSSDGAVGLKGNNGQDIFKLHKWTSKWAL